MRAVLDETLASVPMLSTLGIRTEAASTGHVVLRLPASPALANAAGALHTAAIFAVGELAAAVVLGTHPDLEPFVHLQRGARIKHYAASRSDVTAHATVTPEMLRGITEGMADGVAIVEVPVKILDGHGGDIAELECRFVFRRP